MKERPILFSGPMVQAILSGKKTQTRRVIKGITDPIRGTATENYYVNYRGKTYWCDSNFSFNDSLLSQACPQGHPGDRLWVRETWCRNYFFDGRPGYRADWCNPDPAVVAETKWIPSIHMPRCASRINLEITSVRIERLQDISETDAWCEGCEKGEPTDNGGFFPKDIQIDDHAWDGFDNAKEWFSYIWDKINGKPRKNGADISWEANPWVWVIEFKMVKPIL